MIRRALIFVCSVVAFVTAHLSFAATLPWHAPGWPLRALALVDRAGSTGVDVASTRIVHCGLAAPDANDIRVFDPDGKPVPYQVTFHDPARETLISFRCPLPAPGKPFAIYFGKSDAPVDPMRAIADNKPGSGAPKPGPAPGAGGWIPKAGLVLTTIRRPKPVATQPTDDPYEMVDNPESVSQLVDMMNRSPGVDGGGYRAEISDGVNPFGDSDYYMSIYRGWINIPAAGKYGFCTASNESSFSFIDGKDLVHWPGRHTEDRGKFGGKNGEVAVTAGPHYIEYYHEEVLLFQVAFLGWKPPGAKQYWSIPAEQWLQPHRSTITRIEEASGQPAPLPKVAMTDSVWPSRRRNGQYTRYAFAVDAGSTFDSKGWSFEWSFGDGMTTTGPTAEHIFLALGRFDVTLTATSPTEQKTTRTWPLKVFEVEHIAGGEGFRQGSLKAYAPLVGKYDTAKLITSALVEAGLLLSEAGDRANARRVAEAALTKLDINTEQLADMHLVAAINSALGASNVGGSSRSPEAAKAVAAHLQAAMENQKDPARRLQIAARFIRAVGIDQADLPTAEAIFKGAEKAYKEGPSSNRKLRIAFKETLIALGDARLYARQIDKANLDYRTAEALSDTPIPPQVRASKIGAFPETIDQAIAKGQIEAAMSVAQRWQEELPSDQVRGAVLFYIGKLEQMLGRPAAGVRPLQMAIDLAQGAEFEAEARWYLALCQRDQGDTDGWRTTLTGMVRSGLGGPFRKKALDALAEAASQPAGKVGMEKKP